VSAEAYDKPNRVAQDLESLRGWLPVDAVISDGRPGLLWMDLRDVELSEPLFQQTVERVRSRKAVEKFTEFDTLLQFEKIADSLPPDGFIFHSSRCGSTLVANACRSLTDSIVISEAAAIDKLAVRFITDAPEKGGVREILYSVFLRGVVNALGQGCSRRKRRYFVKFACCSVFVLDRILRIWPHVPWLFVYRNPVETIVSNLANVPDWMLDPDSRVLAKMLNTSPAEIEMMSREELCARAIGSFYTVARQLANDRSMLLNYDDLAEASLLRIVEFFDVSPSKEEVNAIKRAKLIYSKDASLNRAFISDTEAKQSKATELIKQMSANWAEEPYRLLELKRSQTDALR
jgi:hypothetical protein